MNQKPRRVVVPTAALAVLLLATAARAQRPSISEAILGEPGLRRAEASTA